MAPSPPRLRILSGESSSQSPGVDSAFLYLLVQPTIKLKLKSFCIVGGNAVSAFLSWRLQATNACDVTLVWKNGFESVSQYGISFRYVTLSVYSSRTDR